MRFSLQQLTFLALQGIHQATGHYGFPIAVINGVISKRWEYIRPTTDFSPNYDYSGASAMCGRNATTPLFPIKTIKLAPGDTIGFGAMRQSAKFGGRDEDKDMSDFDPNFFMYHDGPATAYLSKAPGELADYEGDGDWFKFAAYGASDGMKWDYSGSDRVAIMNFTIPKSTPPGKYLLRAEHLNINSAYMSTEMYVNCAHVEITGSGEGTPGPVIKFPGAFSAKDPGIWLPNALFRPYEPMDELKNWQGAGPRVWEG